MVTTHQPRGWEDDSHVVDRPVLDLPAAKATVERKHTEQPNQTKPTKQTNKQTNRPNPTQPNQPNQQHATPSTHKRTTEQTHNRATKPGTGTSKLNAQAGQTHARVPSDRKRNKQTNTGAKRNRIEPTTSMRRCGLVHATMAWPHPLLSAAQKGKKRRKGRQHGRAGERCSMPQRCMALHVAAVHATLHVVCIHFASIGRLASWSHFAPHRRVRSEKSIRRTCAAARAVSARHETRWDAASCTPHVAMYTLGD